MDNLCTGVASAGQLGLGFDEGQPSCTYGLCSMELKMSLSISPKSFARCWFEPWSFFMFHSKIFNYDFDESHPHPMAVKLYKLVVVNGHNPGHRMPHNNN